MKFKLFIFFIFLSISFLKAQSILFEGYVYDKDNKKPINGVYIETKFKGTLSDNKGFFSIKLNPDDSISFNHVSYHKKTIFGDKIQNNKIELIFKTNNLKELNLKKGTTFDVIKKALNLIPQNYPQNDFELFAIENSLSTLSYNNKIINQYSLKSLIKLQYPSYKKIFELPKIEVYKNKYTNIEDTNFSNNYIKTNLINPYNLVGFADYVHLRSKFLNFEGYKYFNYKSLGIHTLNNRRCIVINFYKKNEKRVEGTLFIDSVTFAFMGWNYIEYNIEYKNLLKILKHNYIINFSQNENRKWIIDNLNYEQISKYPDTSKKLEIIANFNIIDIKNIPALLQTNAPIQKINLIHLDTEIKQLGDSDFWNSYDSMYKFYLFKNSMIDTTKNKNLYKEVSNEKIKKSNHIINKLNSYFANSCKVKLQINNYTVINSDKIDLMSGFEAKIYKNLFFGIDNNSYIFISRKYNTASYYFILNYKNNWFKNSFNLSPIIGIYNNNIYLDKINLNYKDRNYFLGLRYSFKLSTQFRYGYFLQANYFINDFYKIYNTDLKFIRNNFNFSVGLLTY